MNNQPEDNPTLEETTAVDEDSGSEEHVIDEDLMEPALVDGSEAELSSSDKWEDVLGSGSIMKKILKKGTPNTRPQRSQTCQLRLVCSLLDGTVVQQEDKLTVTLGDCEVVQGLEVAVGLMDLGEICLLKIEPRLAYGEKGLGLLIPPNTTVQFELELLEAKDEEELETLSVDERRERGHRKREKGNWWYSREENQLAIQCYRRALEYLDEVEGGIKFPSNDGDSDVTDTALQQLLEDRITVYNNMAAAQLKLELFDAALQSLQTVLRCQPNNVKALFRKAKIYKGKNDVPSALKILNKAKNISPNDKDIMNELASLEKIREKQKKSEKDLARRMFGGITDNSKNSKQASSSSRLYVWATLGASVTFGLLGLIVYRIKYI